VNRSSNGTGVRERGDAPWSWGLGARLRRRRFVLLRRRQERQGEGRKKTEIKLTRAADVTAYTGKCDLGQGMFTVQAQLVAEELVVPVSRVKLTECDTAVSPDQGTTSGSQATPTNFNSRGLAQARPPRGKRSSGWQSRGGKNQPISSPLRAELSSARAGAASPARN
jgi:Molybdopterin-binding domain of aldehyde dehydrogenase